MHATTCTEAEGLDWRPSDSRGGSDDHRPPTNRERGSQEIGDTICKKNQAQEGYFIGWMLSNVKDQRAGVAGSDASPCWAIFIING